jgi:hypothetical protein
MSCTLDRTNKFRCAHGHAHACHSRDIDNVQLRFSKIHVIEFTETLKRRVLIDVLENKFASSFSADTWDVDFHLVRVVAQFRILTEPLAQLNQHLKGCLENGIDGQIISEINPASTAAHGFEVSEEKL